MKSSAKQLSRGLCATLTLALISAGLAASANAATERIIHVFNGTRGSVPEGELIRDSSGNFYGVTAGGGLTNQGCGGQSCGIVYQLSKVSGAWTETVLHRFGGPGDGFDPTAGLTFDGNGNIFGTAEKGGAHKNGVVFELSPKTGGGWTYSVIYSFGGEGDGGDAGGPAGKLAIDGSGNIFGTTSEGGTQNKGAVFELVNLGGGWGESVLHSFGLTSGDGAYPDGGLIFDGSNNLYGVTGSGGTVVSSVCSSGCGVVYEMSLSGGTWTESVIHAFSGNDGFGPIANLLFAGGNLYGTTEAGGSSLTACGAGCGVVYELAPDSGGWSETVLHSFTQGPSGGGYGGSDPRSTLIMDGSGNLYGTTYYGGLQTGPNLNSGAAFELSPGAGGWTETVLHAFFGGSSGSHPGSGLTFDGSGNLFGGLQSGGTGNNGAIFEITP